MADILLVHGTTQMAAGFDALASELAERGHRALTVQVSSDKNTSQQHAQNLTAQLPPDFAEPIVVAHSASGLLLPALAARLSASHQVWMAATVADFNRKRSFKVEVLADPLNVFNPDWIGIDPTESPVLATHFLFHDVANLPTLRQALSTVALCDLSGVYGETPKFDPTAIPSTYILPLDDRVLRPEWMREVSAERLGVEPVSIPGGHNFYVADPVGAADAILSSM